MKLSALVVKETEQDKAIFCKHPIIRTSSFIWLRNFGNNSAGSPAGGPRSKLAVPVRFGAGVFGPSSFPSADSVCMIAAHKVSLEVTKAGDEFVLGPRALLHY
jgi:hypothetical protein